MNIKIRSYSDKHQKIIIERLLELGFGEVDGVQVPFICKVDVNPFISANKDTISLGDCEVVHNSLCSGQEVTLDDLYSDWFLAKLADVDDMSKFKYRGWYEKKTPKLVKEYTMEELVEKIGNFKLIKKDD